MDSFLKTALRSFKTTGTIKPSSKYLVKDTLQDVDFDTARVIVEFGTGNGCMTRELIAQMNPEAQLFSFEINPEFYAKGLEEFGGNPNVHILNESTFDFDKIIKAYGFDRADYIVSSLPLSLFKSSDTRTLLKNIADHLSPEGLFIQFQYSLDKYRDLKKHFGTVRKRMTLRNLPPAIVYNCRLEEEE